MYHTRTVYPAPSPHPVKNPSYGRSGGGAKNTTTKEMWRDAMKNWMEFKNMNKALVMPFLSLIPAEHSDLYNSTLISNPNGTFHDTFDYFYKKFGNNNEIEMEDSHDIMTQLSNPSEGSEVLHKHFDDRIIFAAFSDNTISAGDVLKMLLNIIIKTGVFQDHYEGWHSLPKDKNI
jgi:hypothetical protein